MGHRLFFIRRCYPLNNTIINADNSFELHPQKRKVRHESPKNHRHLFLHDWSRIVNNSSSYEPKHESRRPRKIKNYDNSFWTKSSQQRTQRRHYVDFGIGILDFMQLCMVD